MTLYECGTNGAYQRHIHNGEIPCDPCLAAHRRHNTARQIRMGRTSSILVPHDALAQLYLSATYAAQARIEQQMGVDVIGAIVKRYANPKKVSA